MEDKTLKKEEGIQEKILTNSENVKEVNNLSNEEISLPIINNTSNVTSKENNDLDNKEEVKADSSSGDKDDSFEMPTMKEENSIENDINNKDGILNSISSSEISTSTNNTIPPKQPSLAPADFSTIFNVESEEKTENKIQNKQAELPKTEENTNVPTENVIIEENSNTQEEKINKDLFNSEEKVLYEIKPEKEGNPDRKSTRLNSSHRG